MLNDYETITVIGKGRYKVEGHKCLFGDCPNIPDYIVSEYGDVVKRSTGRLMKGRRGSDSRRMYTLGGKTHMANRLVHYTFLGPVAKGHVINHIDHDCTNDHHTNLQSVTKANNQHICVPTKRFRNRALSPHAVREIRSRNGEGESMKKLAKEFGVRYQTIQAAISGRRYADVV